MRFNSNFIGYGAEVLEVVICDLKYSNSSLRLVALTRRSHFAPLAISFA